MKKAKDVLRNAGERVLLSGNEAVARGCLEAGVAVATAYPGTPASEVLEVLGDVASERGFHAEFSVNEAVAFEVAAGAALAGVRSVMSTKMLGINLIADPLTVISVTGVRAGFLIVTADDPQQFSSQNAEDTRFFGMLAKVPVLEPVDGQEAKDMTKYAFELSEKLELPVFLRITPRICHSSFDVELGEMQDIKREGKFIKDPKRFVMISTYSRPRQPVLNAKIQEASRLANSNPWNLTFDFKGGRSVDGKGAFNTFGVIASGIVYPFVEEVIEKTALSARVLKLASTYPLPEDLIESFLRRLDQVLIVEEGDPVTEMQVRALAQHRKVDVRIIGKQDDILPRSGELNPDIIGDAMEKIFGKRFREELTEPYIRADSLVTPRVPALCAGCPHRSSFFSIKEAIKKLGKGGSIMGDRGCYNQGAYEPLQGMDTCICMGASIAMASGVYHSGAREPSLAVIGDGTFYHAGMPSLLNAVHNWSNITVMILDNSITAMTGHQPNPGTGKNLMSREVPHANLLKIVKALGVEHVEVINAYDTKLLVETVLREMEYDGPSVIISRAPCAIVVERELRKRKLKTFKADVSLEKCTGCKACMKKIGCPAFGWSNDPKPHLTILPHCNGCGLCVEVCPFKAISVPGKGEKVKGVTVRPKEVKA